VSGATHAAARVAVRRAALADAALIHEITQRAWKGTVADDSSAFGETARTVERAIEAGGAFVAEVDSVAVGSVRFVPVAGDARAWEVKRMGVLPGHRGGDLGARLLEAVEAAAAANGVGTIQLGVRTDQPRLVTWYEALGYRLDPTVRIASCSPRARPIPMSKQLGPARGAPMRMT
jgi:GNAT superfamily N-acetyltransferase